MEGVGQFGGMAVKDAYELLDFFLQFWSALKSAADGAPIEFALQAFAAFALFIGAIFVQWGRLFLRVGKKVVEYFSASRRLRRTYREITRTRSSGRWVRRVSPKDRALQVTMAKSKPILLVANQKGGVGKTTLAANLGAYFALHRAKRVLFIDLDFQGTLSETLRVMADVDAEDGGLVSDLLTTDFGRTERARRESVSKLFERRRRFFSEQVQTDPGDMQYSSFYDASERLAEIEDWLMLKWVMRLDRHDARFQLARFLQSAEVQKWFDVVILDAPPRDTTAGINGLCACTHILIPTRADLFSWRGAYRYLVAASRHHDLLCPQARVVGFVGTMTPTASRHGMAPDGLQRPIDDLQNHTLESPDTRATKPLLSYWPTGSTFDYLGTMPTRKAFTDDTGRRITYISTSEERKMIRAIGDEVGRRLFPGETYGRESARADEKTGRSIGRAEARQDS